MSDEERSDYDVSTHSDLVTEESGLDPSHDVEAYTKVLLRGFEDYHKNMTQKANAIYEKYCRQGMYVVEIGLRELNELGEECGVRVMQTNNGIWPAGVLGILSRTMGHLTMTASKLRDSAKPFDVIDLVGYAANGSAGADAN